MNYRLIGKTLGGTLLIEAGAIFLSMCIALLYGEDLKPFWITILALLVIGSLLYRLKQKSTAFFTRDAFVCVAGIWIAFSLFGAIPFRIDGTFGHYVNCIFETVSGFTTTGATILTEIESKGKGLLFWRSLTHWMGGMGVLVLTSALLPQKFRAQHLMKAEVPGPTKDKLVPKLAQSSKILYAMYLGLTVIQVLCLLLFTDMDLYHAVVESFSTAGTGGFSVMNASIAGYNSPAAEVIITIFMMLFGVNFSVHFLVITGKFRQALKNEEVRFYFLIFAVAAVAIAINILSMYGSFSTSLRYSAFQVATVMTTTGSITQDFNLWPQFSRSILMTLMLIGACAGSTGGAIKCSRVLILGKSIAREIRRIIHPRAVDVVRLDGKAVDESVVTSVLRFTAAYFTVIVVAYLLVSLDNVSNTTSLSAVISCIGNVGPGLEAVGPVGNYNLFSPFSKLVLSFCMLAGRLEVFPMLIFFMPSVWKRA